LENLQLSTENCLKKKIDSGKSEDSGKSKFDNQSGSSGSISPPSQQALSSLITRLPAIPRSTICKVLAINRSGTYYQSKTISQDQKLVNLIAQIRVDNPFYGMKRLVLCLSIEHNMTVNIKRIRRVCNTYNLKARTRRKHPHKRDINLSDTGIPHLVKEMSENNQINKPNQVWASDFTYLKYCGLWYYLATIIDVFTKEIVGFRFSSNHTTSLISQTLQSAIQKYGIPTIIHSDQGSEYRSYEYQEKLKEYGITCSMSKKSSPWENGFQESFYGKFKDELELNMFPRHAGFAELYNYITNQIDYYNNYRIHTTIRNIPARFRLKYDDKYLNQIPTKSVKQKRI
jgi:putative transposase